MKDSKKNEPLKGEIRNIYRICASGAHGNPKAKSMFTYGLRSSDGKTVRCNLDWDYEKNLHKIHSGKDVTEFTREEWQKVALTVGKHEQSAVANKIIDNRRPQPKP